MTKIILTTYIKAPVELCFDLSRSVELHQISTNHTNERVIAGRHSGLFEKGDTVTWRARHLGFYQTLQMKITAMNFPHSFEDRMIRGAFRSLVHTHLFTENDQVSCMTDVFCYKVPYGLPGRLFDLVILKAYMTRLLVRRNTAIKEFAEMGKKP